MVLVLCAVLILGTLLRYARSLDTGEREQARWAVLGALLTFGGMGLLLAVAAGRGLSGIGGLGPWGNVLATAFILAFPACLVLGLTAPQLLPVDTVLWWLLALGLAAVLLAGIAVALAPLGFGWAVAAVAVLTVPALFGSTRLTTWIVYRGRRSPDAAGERFLRSLETAGGAEATPAVLVEIAAESLRAAGVAFEGSALASTAVGELGDRVEDIPIVFHGVPLGVLRLAPRPGETSLTARDRAVALELARRAAPALHDAATLIELQHARDRIVRAREEQRRQLRRELHDDLAPALAGVALAAEGLVRTLPAGANRQTAVALLADAKDAATRARELAYGLRPAVLDDRGLLAAIRDRVGADSRVEIAEASLPPSLSAAVELAALRIVQEAVTNAGRHADANRIEVRVHGEGDALHVLIADDGRGLPDDSRTGLGLRSIRERAEELGGAVRLSSSGPLGGMLIEAFLPLGVS